MVDGLLSVLIPKAYAVCTLISGATTTECMDTTTLGTQIGNTNTGAYNFISVFFTNYWYFVLGFLILIGVIGFGKRAVQALFR